MPDYSKGKIYKLWSPSKNLIYYGSTVETLGSRLSKHVYKHKKYKEDNNNGYCCSYLIIDCEDYKIELIENYPCNNKQQLLRKEGEYQKANECVNTTIAGRTKKEYYQDNKKTSDEQIKNWRKNNKEKAAKIAHIYYIKNKEKILEYNKCEARKEYQKQYRLKKKEQLKEQV